MKKATSTDREASRLRMQKKREADLKRQQKQRVKNVMKRAIQAAKKGRSYKPQGKDIKQMQQVADQAVGKLQKKLEKT